VGKNRLRRSPFRTWRCFSACKKSWGCRQERLPPSRTRLRNSAPKFGACIKPEFCKSLKFYGRFPTFSVLGEDIFKSVVWTPGVRRPASWTCPRLEARRASPDPARPARRPTRSGRPDWRGVAQGERSARFQVPTCCLWQIFCCSQIKSVFYRCFDKNRTFLPCITKLGRFHEHLMITDQGTWLSSVNLQDLIYLYTIALPFVKMPEFWENYLNLNLKFSFRIL